MRVYVYAYRSCVVSHSLSRNIAACSEASVPASERDSHSAWPVWL